MYLSVKNFMDFLKVFTNSTNSLRQVSTCANTLKEPKLLDIPVVKGYLRMYLLAVGYFVLSVKTFVVKK